MTAQDYEMLYRKYYERIENYARWNGALDRSEEVAQEVFAVVWLKREELVVTDNIKLWLKETAKNVIRNEARKKRMQENLLDEEWMLYVGHMDDGFSVTEWEVVLKQILNPREYRLFWEHYCLGYSIREMAGQEGVLEDSLRVKLWRIKEKVRCDVIKHN